MKRLLILTSLLAVAAPVGAQPVWRLERSPSIEIGRAPIELHNVADAAFLQSGELAIADAGNNRIVVVSPRGQLVRAIGRAGQGPGEFRGLSRLSVIGDTLVGFDVLLSRTTAHLADGTHVNTRALPSLNERPVFLRDAVTSTQFVGVIPVRSTAQTAGLRSDSIAIVLADSAARPLTMREWQYTYTVVQGSGSSTYGTPFLGETLVEAVGGRVVIVPRGSAVVEIVDPASGAMRRVNLPIRRRPFDRAVVTAYRDTLLAQNGRAASGAAASARIRQVFGNRFPIPGGSLTPAVEQMTVVGRNVWVQAASAEPGPTSTWYVVDPAAGRVIGRVDLPRAWSVLGGDARRVIVLVRGASNVEHVRVYTITNAPRS
jgi:hypothetical protein